MIAVGAYSTRTSGQFDLKSLDPKPIAAAADHAIRAGLQVFHNKFGEGRVLAVEGAGDDARAQVSFARHGVKWLALAVARLTVVD